MRALLAVGLCAAAVALSGCGGGSDDTGSTTTTAPSATTQAAPAPSATGPPASGQSAGDGEQKQTHKHSQAEGSANGGSGVTKQSDSSPAPVKPPRVSSAPIAGTKAPAPGVKTVKGADDSVQTYGVESDAAARTQAATALAAYLDARRREEWASACEALATRPKEQLQKLAKSLSQQGKETSGCAAAMAALGEGSPQPPGTTITEVLSLRGGGDVPGDPSYLIYTGPPGQTLYSMPMYLEAGGWKVGLAVPAELPL